MNSTSEPKSDRKAADADKAIYRVTRFAILARPTTVTGPAPRRLMKGT